MDQAKKVTEEKKAVEEATMRIASNEKAKKQASILKVTVCGKNCTSMDGACGLARSATERNREPYYTRLNRLPETEEFLHERVECSSCTERAVKVCEACSLLVCSISTCWKHGSCPYCQDCCDEVVTNSDDEPLGWRVEPAQPSYRALPGSRSADKAWELADRSMAVDTAQCLAIQTFDTLREGVRLLTKAAQDMKDVAGNEALNAKRRRLETTQATQSGTNDKEGTRRAWKPMVFWTQQGFSEAPVKEEALRG